MYVDRIICLSSIANHDNNLTVLGNLELGLGLGLEDMKSFIMTVTDWSTNVSEVEVTAHVSCDIHPSRVKQGDIASCILTDIV